MLTKTTHPLRLTLALGVEDESDDESASSLAMPMLLCCKTGTLPVKSQHFAENENQDHADEDPGLQHVRSDALVADNADAVPSGKGRETN